MIEHPILFSAPMVLAILAGRKTQTRRVVKSQPPARPAGVRPHKIGFTSDDEGEDLCAYSQSPGNGGWTACCPYGQAGDRLWVRESFQALFADDVEDHYQTDYKTGKGYRVYYMATDERHEFVNADDDLSDAITPSIFMPRWASRITLEVTGVRVERLWKIDDDDAKAEGVYPTATGLYAPGQFIGEYAKLWDKINAKRAPWASNPFVWVIEFRRIDAS